MAERKHTYFDVGGVFPQVVEVRRKVERTHTRWGDEVVTTKTPIYDINLRGHVYTATPEPTDGNPM